MIVLNTVLGCDEDSCEHVVEVLVDVTLDINGRPTFTIPNLPEGWSGKFGRHYCSQHTPIIP